MLFSFDLYYNHLRAYIVNERLHIANLSRKKKNICINMKMLLAPNRRIAAFLLPK